MTICKRTVSLILSFLLVFSMFSSTFVFETFAAANPTLSLESKTVKVAEQFKVNVLLSNAASVYGGNFTLQYDSSLLSADSYTFGSIVSGHTKNCNLDYQSAGNLIRVTFSGAEAVSSDGTLVTFTFTAKKAGTASLQFTSYKMYDENGSSLTTSTSGASVTINPAVTSSPALSITSKTVTAGQTVSVPVSISDSDDVYGGNFTLQYDSSLLSADSYTFGSIVSGHTKNCNLDYQSAGNQIRVTFSGAEAVSSDGTLVTFTFTAKKAGTASLQFTSYKMYDENGSSLTTNTSGASVTINPAVTSSPALSITNKTVTAGQTVSVPVAISNSDDVYGGNFTLQYDSSLLTADSYTFGGIVSGHTKNCNLDYQSAGNLIRVTFSGAEAVSSDGTLVTFTFTAKKAGTASLQFTSYKMYDDNGSSLYTTVSKGSVIINPEPVVELDSIDITQNPTKTTYYIGDSLNTTGLKLKLTYSDGSTETITSGFTTSGFSSSTAGTKTVTVAYGGFTDTFAITVNTPSITLSSSSKTLTVGDTATLTATTTPSGQSVTWTSSDTSVATVSGGTITAKAKGTSTITAKFTYNGITYSEVCVVTVNRVVITPNLSITNKTVTAGQTVSVPIDISNSDDVYGGNFTLQYDSSLLTADSYTFGSIVNGHTKNCNLDYQSAGNLIRVTFSGAEAVSSDGTLVTFTFASKKAGTASLQFTSYKMYDDNGSSLDTTVTKGSVVIKAEPVAGLASIEIAQPPTKATCFIGDPLNTSGLKLRLIYSDGKIEIITSGFTTSGFNSSTVGEKTVTVSYGGFTDTFTIKVNTPSIALSIKEKTLSVGDISTVEARTVPDDQSVVWSSSDTSVATVSNGTITTKAKGTATITAKFTYNGIEYSETVLVSVAGTVDSDKTYVLVDGIYYEVEYGQIITYVYNIACSDYISAIHSITHYEDSGLKLLSGYKFPKLTKAISNDSITGKLICVYSNLNNLVGFPFKHDGVMREENQLLVANFKIVGGPGVYEIDTEILGMLDDDLNRIIEDNVQVNNSTALQRGGLILDVTPVDPTESEYQLGDVDGNGVINILDVTLIQRYIAKLTTIPEDRIVCADTDKDGEITIMDATKIQRFIAQHIPKL